MTNSSFPDSPAAPAKRRLPVTLIVLVILLLMIACGGCAILFGPAIQPAIAGAQLPSICTQRNHDMDAQACSAWAQSAVRSPAFAGCMDGYQANDTASADTLYDCLVQQGAGPTE